MRQFAAQGFQYGEAAHAPNRKCRWAGRARRATAMHSWRCYASILTAMRIPILTFMISAMALAQTPLPVADAGRLESMHGKTVMLFTRIRTTIPSAARARCTKLAQNGNRIHIVIYTNDILTIIPPPGPPRDTNHSHALNRWLSGPPFLQAYYDPPSPVGFE